MARLSTERPGAGHEPGSARDRPGVDDSFLGMARLAARDPLSRQRIVSALAAMRLDAQERATILARFLAAGLD